MLQVRLLELKRIPRTVPTVESAKAFSLLGQRGDKIRTNVVANLLIGPCELFTMGGRCWSHNGYII
jgi:hypothetical protein